jgi:hypothetical protein
MERHVALLEGHIARLEKETTKLAETLKVRAPSPAAQRCQVACNPKTFILNPLA